MAKDEIASTDWLAPAAKGRGMVRRHPGRLSRGLIAWGVMLSVALALVSVPGFAADGPSPPVASPPPAAAPDETPKPETHLFDSGKLLATGGLSQIEGAGGGGLASWALITGYGTENAIGTSAHGTTVYLSNFTLNSAGVGVGLFDRLEFTYDRQWFDTRSTGAALGLGNGFVFRQDIFGAKVKLAGDAVFDQDSWMPQIAAGVQYKKNDRAAVLKAIGAKSDHGTDFYIAATKLFLAQSLLVDATLRETKANQFGILGFGGDKNNAYTTQFEGSVAYLLTRQLAAGFEIRTKPNNLGFAREDNAGDVFISYFLNKNLSATLAYLYMGDVATRTNQNGPYFSIQSRRPSAFLRVAAASS